MTTEIVLLIILTIFTFFDAVRYTYFFIKKKYRYILKNSVFVSENRIFNIVATFCFKYAFFIICILILIII